MSADKSGGPAFAMGIPSETHRDHVQEGMTLRDYFAAHAPITMKEVWGIWSTSRPFEETIGKADERRAFLHFFATIRGEYADAMIRGRSK